MINWSQKKKLQNSEFSLSCPNKRQVLDVSTRQGRCKWVHTNVVGPPRDKTIEQKNWDARYERKSAKNDGRR